MPYQNQGEVMQKDISRSVPGDFRQRAVKLSALGLVIVAAYIAAQMLSDIASLKIGYYTFQAVPYLDS